MKKKQKTNIFFMLLIFACLLFVNDYKIAYSEEVDKHKENYSINNSIENFTLTTDIPSPQEIGCKIKVTANVAKKENLLFQFWTFDGVKWQVVQNYSSKNVFEWCPQKQGGYIIWVDVKKIDSPRERDTYKEIYFKVCDKLSIQGQTVNIVEKNLNWNGSFTYNNKPDMIILHHIEASRPGSTIPIEDVHGWHLGNGWIGIGYHFYVTKDGTIYRGRPEDAEGAHTIGYNQRSIGIAAEGKYETEDMPYEQKQAITKLGIYIKNKYGINAVKGHGEVYSTNCPGKNYPLTEIRDSIMKEADKDSNKHKEGWEFASGKWYYYDNNGTMKTNWYKVGSQWYYFDKDGTMKTNWYKVGNGWYYLGEDGAMRTNWQYEGKRWYYLASDGAMRTGWVLVSGKWYYLNSGGDMAVNTTIGRYRLGSDGAWIK